MVKILNPPTPRAHCASNSDRLVNDLENRIHDETEQLLLDIRRIAPSGEPYVLFGDLFDDDDVQQYYESLIGTLKSAKKRGCITFQGQMLLKGMSDKIQVSIVERAETQIYKIGSVPVPTTEKNDAAKPYPTLVANKPNIPNRLGKSMAENKENHKTIPPLKPPPANRIFTFSPKATRREKKLSPRSGGACTDTEGDDDCEVYGVGGWSDSEADHNIRRSPRRLVLPSIFLQDIRLSSNGGRPPAPWKIRKAASTSAVMPRRELEVQVIHTPIKEPRVGLMTADEVLESTPESIAVTDNVKPASVTKPKRVIPAPKRNLSLPLARNSSSSMKSAEIVSMVDDEVVRLLADIRRIGSHPGEPSVTFGELFDDDVVQNTYEALVGTLRSAKRQGKIQFNGQMLLKGMHDNVVIFVVEDV